MRKIVAPFGQGDALLNQEEMAHRRQNIAPVQLKSDSPWQELDRAHEGSWIPEPVRNSRFGYRDLRLRTSPMWYGMD